MSKNISYLSNVVYQGEIYQVVWIYESGLCEIRAQDEKVKLVELSELQRIEIVNEKETDMPE